MTPNPLVTVYITNYNYGQYIQEAIDSVLNQTYNNLEIIIIDDGSTDDSKNTIENYSRNDNIKIIYQQNKGLNVTNNVAIRASDGKYIMRLDADDFLDPSAVEKMVSELESNSELGLIFPDYYYVNEIGEIIGQEKRHDFDNEVTLFDQPAHGACTLIRKDNLVAVGGYNESYNCQDGYELWVKFISHYKVTNYSEPLFYYRQHGKNLTKSEDRILETRAKINSNYVKSQNYHSDSIAVIPVRGTENDHAFISLGGVTLLERKITAALASENIKKVVVTSPNSSVGDIIEKVDSAEKEIIFHHRNKQLARFNTTLNPVISEVLELESIKEDKMTAIVVLTVEYPFVSPAKIDDAVNTLLLFNSDSLLAVRADSSVFYQHHGDGLHAIMNRDKYTKLEREALFKQVGGINAVLVESFKKHKEVICGQIGHMVVDQKSAHGIFSEHDLSIAELMVTM